MIEFSNFQADGDIVNCRMRLRIPSAETGEVVDTVVDHAWRFNAEGKVVEVTPRQQEAVAQAVRSFGGDGS